MSREQPTHGHGCTAKTFSHFPFPAAVSVLTSLLPVFNTAPLLGAREASRLQGQLQETLVIRRSLPASSAHHGLRIILRAYRGVVAKTQMHQNLATCWQLRMQTASATGYSAGTAHLTDFQVGGVNSRGKRSIIRPDATPARLRMWGLGSERCACHSLQG